MLVMAPGSLPGLLCASGSQPVILGASVPQFTFTTFVTEDSDKHWIFFPFSYFLKQL